MHPHLMGLCGGGVTWGQRRQLQPQPCCLKRWLPCGLCTRQDLCDVIHHFPVAQPALEGFMELITAFQGDKQASLRHTL